DCRAGGEQRDLGVLCRRDNLVSPGGATVHLLDPKPQLRQVLPRERENAGGLRMLERELPALDRLDRIAWTEDVEVRHGAQRGQMFYWLVRRPVLPEPGRIVRPHVGHAFPPERRRGQRRPPTVG